MAEASYPEDLKYHADHDWARIEGDQATFGITWYAQDALGEVVFFDPPEVGASVTKDEAYAEVESVKAVSDVFAPLSGEIVEVNTDTDGGLADGLLVFLGIGRVPFMIWLASFLLAFAGLGVGIQALADSPEKVNQDPYGEGWMVKIRLSDASEVDQLMDVNAYRELLQSGS